MLSSTDTDSFASDSMEGQIARAIIALIEAVFSLQELAAYAGVW